MLRGSENSQNQVLAAIGSAVVLCALLAALVVEVNPFSGRPEGQMSIAIETPYLGQGVEVGTQMVLHGVKVGQVQNVTSLPGGGVRLATDLDKRPVAGLTDTMAIDFRPINYFGVPGINIIPSPGGQALHDGSKISVVPAGNFTIPELLTQLGDISRSALTPRLITVVDRVTRYTDGLDPLFESMLMATRAVADVQKVPTARLLANSATAVAALPPFADAVVDAGIRSFDSQYSPVPNGSAIAVSDKLTQRPPFNEGFRNPTLAEAPSWFFYENYKAFLELAANGLFLSVGTLANSHVDDLLPLVTGIKSLSNTAPALLRPNDIAKTLAEARSRLETLFGGNGEQRALRVRILLDSLPGMAVPLGVIMENRPGVQPGTSQAEVRGRQ